MPARGICMASAKGGSGETVLTATFGTFLATIGRRVLLIDTDAAINGLTVLFLKEARVRGELAIAAGGTPHGIYELSDGHPPEVVTLKKHLDLIPATYAF